MKNMKLQLLILSVFLGLGHLQAQSASSNSAPSDATIGYTYDVDLAKKIINEFQLTPNAENAVVKPIVEAKDFPKLNSKDKLNNHYNDKLNTWMENNSVLIIQTLKSRKEIVHPFGN
jgi:hypothetical protein